MPMGLIGAVLVSAGPQRVPPPSEKLLHRLCDGVRTEAPSGGFILERIQFAAIVPYRHNVGRGSRDIPAATLKVLVGAAYQHQVAGWFERVRAAGGIFRVAAVRSLREPLVSMLFEPGRLLLAYPAPRSAPHAQPPVPGGNDADDENEQGLEGAEGVPQAAAAAQQPRVSVRENLIGACSVLQRAIGMCQEQVPHEELGAVLGELCDSLAGISDFLHPQIVVKKKTRSGLSVFTPSHITKAVLASTHIKDINVHWRSLVRDVLALFVNPDLIGDSLAQAIRATRTRDFSRVDMMTMNVQRLRYQEHLGTTLGFFRYLSSDASPQRLLEIFVARMLSISVANVRRVLAGEIVLREAWEPPRTLPLSVLGAGETTSMRKALRCMDKIWLECGVKSPGEALLEIVNDEVQDVRTRATVVESLSARLEIAVMFFDLGEAKTRQAPGLLKDIEALEEQKDIPGLEEFLADIRGRHALPKNWWKFLWPRTAGLHGWKHAMDHCVQGASESIENPEFLQWLNELALFCNNHVLLDRFYRLGGIDDEQPTAEHRSLMQAVSKVPKPLDSRWEYYTKMTRVFIDNEELFKKFSRKAGKQLDMSSKPDLKIRTFVMNMKNAECWGQCKGADIVFRILDGFSRGCERCAPGCHEKYEGGCVNNSVLLPLYAAGRRDEELQDIISCTGKLGSLAFELVASGLSNKKIGVILRRTNRQIWIAAAIYDTKTLAIVQFPFRITALASAEPPWNGDLAVAKRSASHCKLLQEKDFWM